MRIQSEILSSLNQAVIATDRSGAIQEWNQAARDLYGWSRDEVLGKNVVQVTPSDLSRTEAESILSRLAAGEIWSGEFSVMDRRGRKFLISVTDLPIRDQEGEVVGIVGISSLAHATPQRISVYEWLTEFAERVRPVVGREFRVRVDEGLSVLAQRQHLDQIVAGIVATLHDAFEPEVPIALSAAELSSDSPFFLGFARLAEGCIHIRVSAGSGVAQQEKSLSRVFSSKKAAASIAALVARADGMFYFESFGAAAEVVFHLFLPRHP